MELLVAIGHFAGVLIAIVLIGVLLDIFDFSKQAQYGKHLRHEVAISLGIRRDQVDWLEWDREVAKVLQEKFSNDRLSNRVADLFGIVSVAWSWFGFLTMVFLFLGAAWATFPDDLGMAIWAWSVLVAFVLFTASGRLLDFLCNLFTGRSPGQPKATRAALRKAALEIDQRTET